LSICHLNLYFEKFTWPLLRFVLPRTLPLSLSHSLSFTLPLSVSLTLYFYLSSTIFFALTWLRCFGNADNISCASAAVGTAQLHLLPLPLVHLSPCLLTLAPVLVLYHFSAVFLLAIQLILYPTLSQPLRLPHATVSVCVSL